MQTKNIDHPNVIVFPPVILAATILTGFALQWGWPLGFLASFDRRMLIAGGIVFILAGIAIAATGRRAMVRLGTNVSPLQPTTAIVTNGIFAHTRNPLYSGGTLLMIGIALAFALDWLILLIVPSLMALHFGVVRREEQYLERKFGDEFRRYRASVPRYGFRL